jgi:hypothetical protein
MDKPLYCVKCKKKTNSKNIKQVMTKNKRKMLKGICPICDTTQCQFIK